MDDSYVGSDFWCVSSKFGNSKMADTFMARGLWWVAYGLQDRTKGSGARAQMATVKVGDRLLLKVSNNRDKDIVGIAAIGIVQAHLNGTLIVDWAKLTYVYSMPSMGVWTTIGKIDMTNHNNVVNITNICIGRPAIN